MTITLKPETEQLINDALKTGHYKDADEVMQRALRLLQAEHHASPSTVEECQEAAARIRTLRQGNTLGGLTIRALINAGRR
jgi:putative addiction module CopG family antidote